MVTGPANTASILAIHVILNIHVPFDRYVLTIRGNSLITR
jgi:hypothetical protein